jgi:hypothetical protein
MVPLVAIVIFSGCHDDHEEKQRLENKLKEQQQKTGEWMVVAGVLGIGGTVLFGVGCAIGSTARRRQVKRDE